MQEMRGFAVLALVLGACSFKPGALPADGGPDGPPPITVGFAKTTTLADEASSTVSIRVVLSAPSDEAVTVAYAITGGTATQTTDYTGSDGSLTFAPGDVEEVIEISIVPDGAEEPDETVELELSSVTGNNVALANALHTMTIAANVLPRVSFATTSSMGAEDSSPTINVVLDTAPSVVTTVDVVASGTSTATGGGVDYTLSTTTVTFAIGETSKPVTLTVNNDTLDENDENAILTLDNPTSVILASTNTTRTHLIQDNDAPPTVTFAAGAASSIAEAGTMVDLTVSLSTASGKDITVDFAVGGGSSATATTDFSIGTTSPLSFPAGMTSKTIRVNVVQDTAIEVGESVVLTLGPLDTTIVTAGTNTTHTLTITDDDGSCLGTGAFAACFATPSNTANLSGAIDTGSSGLCSATPPVGWSGQPASCFVVAQTINVAAITVTGTKPLVLWATQNIAITGNIDIASHRGAGVGAGANIGCGTYSDNPADATSTSSGAGGGGAGGSFRSVGGAGGQGNGTANSGGSALAAVGVPATLRGGCNGQKGGNGNPGGTSNGGDPGPGGGSLYLVAGGTLSVSSGVIVNASGAAGTALTNTNNGDRAGGGGGGSGGMIKLQAATFSVNGAVFMANGGGGSKGGDDNDPGANGNDPSTASPTTAPLGGSAGNGGANGGNGFAGTTQATAGADGGGNNGGGGGGGGGGHVEANAALTGATVSTGP
jgi:hypothetical protein